ncbi:hypothetical protein BDZ45DRAFT_29127 [Acephala macrosclerotiorum]|nr:hypothetical protein BDZ45DRAFT_29127 [Acephala macrosclerotiorum]
MLSSISIDPSHEMDTQTQSPTDDHARSRINISTTMQMPVGMRHPNIITFLPCCVLPSSSLFIINRSMPKTRHHFL